MAVYVSGENNFNQILSTENKSITSPQKLDIDFSQVISYSIYRYFSVIVLDGGIPCAIGNNTGWPIHKSLPRFINEWTPYTITDDDEQEYLVESAVCGLNYTLYKLRLPTNNSDSRLAIVKKGIMKGKPLFLDTGNWIPISLYGGKDICAAIDEKGAVHVINNSVISDPKHSTKVLFLPNNELSISVCFCGNSIYSLSGQKIVYEFQLSDLAQGKKEFSRTIELNNINVNSISGVFNHCIAVSTNGDVFARGSNEDGKLGIGDGIVESQKFVNLSSLKGQKIKDAFAGCYHSLFLNENGDVLACGNNTSGELFIDDRFGQKIYQPILSSMKTNSNFCIAGFHVSAILFDCLPPKNSPNQTLQLKTPYPYPQLLMNSNQSQANESNEKLLEEIRKLKQTILEQTEVSELLQEIVNTQIEQFAKLNKQNEKMKKILKSNQIEIDFDSDDSNTNGNENLNSSDKPVSNNDNDNDDNDIDDVDDEEIVFIKCNNKDDNKIRIDKEKDTNLMNDKSEIENQGKTFNSKINREENAPIKSIIDTDDIEYDYDDDDEEVRYGFGENNIENTKIDKEIINDKKYDDDNNVDNDKDVDIDSENDVDDDNNVDNDSDNDDDNNVVDDDDDDDYDDNSANFTDELKSM